jgi:hypothetical protein
MLGLALLLGSAIAFTQCGGGGLPTSPAPVAVVDPNNPVVTDPPVVPNPDPVVPTMPPVIPTPGSSSTVVNVLGDTGWCGSPALAPLARLFERFDGDILLAGDLAYPSGTMAEFRNCFEPSFGKFKSRMRATPGNHDYVSSVSAQSYFEYFGDRSGPNRLGYYSFKAAEWTVLMLNSNVPINRGSAQYAFVLNTMQQTPTRCTMAVLHHPFDSSGINGPTPSLREVWELMYNLGTRAGSLPVPRPRPGLRGPGGRRARGPGRPRCRARPVGGLLPLRCLARRRAALSDELDPAAAHHPTGRRRPGHRRPGPGDRLAR